MRNHKTIVSSGRRIFRFLLLAANLLLPPVLIGTLFQNPWICLATAIAHSLLLYAIIHPRCTWLGPLIASFPTDKREVWLTIDDGPDPRQTRQLGHELQKRGVRATFFVIGDKVAAHPELANELLTCGHTIGLHTQTHPQWSFWCAGRRRIQREIEDGLKTLKSLGISTNLFRSPVGHKPPALHGILRNKNLHFIAWTASARDGFGVTPETALKRVLKNTKPGAIILLHEGRTHSVETIFSVIDTLLQQGYRFTIPPSFE